MVIVLFEVTMKEGKTERYLEMAAGLAGMLAGAKGLLSAERFSSMKTPNKLLSMSVWESEEAVAEWRNNAEHRMRQQEGRESVFENFLITVVAPLRVYTPEEQEQAPADSNAFFAK